MSKASLKSKPLSSALPVTAEEAFGPLFAPLDRVKRRVVDLGHDEEYVSWRVAREVPEGLILRDGMQHWMEETLWVPRRTPGCSFALRIHGEEYEFSRLLGRRGQNSKSDQAA